MENSKTVGQCKVPFGDLPKGAITMHVVVQPPLTKAKTGKFVPSITNVWKYVVVALSLIFFGI